MELVFDTYRPGGGEVKEIQVKTHKEYRKVVSDYLIDHTDNFVTVRGKKSLIIEQGWGSDYDVYEVDNKKTRISQPMDLAIDYAYENANKD